MKLRNKLGWWWHTPEDTLDKIDETNLVRDTRVFVHVLWRLLTDPVLPLDYAAWATRLSNELQALARQIGDRLSLAPVIDAARAVSEAAAAVRTLPPMKANAALMQLSRILVPLHTGIGGRFAHDPALPQPPWPVLAALRELAAAPASDEVRFAAVAARRARNRLMHALGRARDVVDQAREVQQTAAE